MSTSIGIRSLLRLALVCVAVGAPVTAARTQGVEADSVAPVFRRAQRLVNDGQGAEGRALVDSVLQSTEPRSPAEAEALFWRATLAESWEAAQRDYLRIMLEHERSPRSADAMLRLAQGEVARGDREAAVRYLERLARESPASPARAEGGLWHGRLLLERGARTDGCGVLRASRSFVRPGAVELENQFEYLLRGCPVVDAATAAVVAVPTPVPAAPVPAPIPAPIPAAPAETTTVSPPSVAAPPATTPRAAGAPRWSVQVAAYTAAADARALVERLRVRGYAARVDGNSAPFRVRFGLFASRAEAAAAASAYKSKERGDALVVEAPRG